MADTDKPAIPIYSAYSMVQIESKAWLHHLRCDSTYVTPLSQLLVKEAERICGFYDGALNIDSKHGDALQVTGVIVRPRIVALIVRTFSGNISVNTLSDAIENVLPKDALVQLPYWS